MNKIWTIGALLQWTQQYFAGKGIDSPRLDAEILLAHVLHKERIYLYAHYDEPMNGEELAAYRAMVKQRADRLSVAHILGTKAFMGLDFKVSEDVLIPRPETEMLVETVVAAAEGTAPAIIDIGTGSGAIILSLLHYLPQATGKGVDISPKALAIAAENGRTLGLDGRVTWIESDLFTKVPQGACDWLVSNPPYLTKGDMEHLQPEVRHDPALALRWCRRLLLLAGPVRRRRRTGILSPHRRRKPGLRQSRRPLCRRNRRRPGRRRDGCFLPPWRL